MIAIVLSLQRGEAMKKWYGILLMTGKKVNGINSNLDQSIPKARQHKRRLEKLNFENSTYHIVEVKKI